MFNFFKKKEKEIQEFVFSNLDNELKSWRLEKKLNISWCVDFIDRSRSLKIPDEEINKYIEKIFLDLENSDIEYIWKVFGQYTTDEKEMELFLKFRIWKYFLFIACNSDYLNHYKINGNTLEDLKNFCNNLDTSLNKEDSLTIFDEGLKAFRYVKIIDAFLVFWKMCLELKWFNEYSLFSRIRDYVNSFWKIILNKNLLKINEIENKELEKYLKEMEIIWVDNIKVVKEFTPLFQKTKRLSEITEEIKRLNLEIQDIRNSI